MNSLDIFVAFEKQFNFGNKMSYKPADSKKEEFRKYLEKAGVLDALTKTLVTLYEEPEKPNNALDFLRKNLCNASTLFFS